MTLISNVRDTGEITGCVGVAGVVLFVCIYVFMHVLEEIIVTPSI